jgi:hypothetical protein
LDRCQFPCTVSGQARCNRQHPSAAPSATGVHLHIVVQRLHTHHSSEAHMPRISQVGDSRCCGAAIQPGQSSTLLVCRVNSQQHSD